MEPFFETVLKPCDAASLCLLPRGLFFFFFWKSRRAEYVFFDDNQSSIKDNWYVL